MKEQIWVLKLDAIFKASKRKWRKIICASWNKIDRKGEKITKVEGGKNDFDVWTSYVCLNKRAPSMFTN